MNDSDSDSDPDYSQMNYDSDHEMSQQDQNKLWMLELINSLIKYDDKKFFMENRKFSESRAQQRLHKEYQTKFKNLLEVHEKDREKNKEVHEKEKQNLRDLQNNETLELRNWYNKEKKNISQETIKKTKISELTKKYNAIKLKLIYEFVCSYVIDCIRENKNWNYEETEKELNESLNYYVKQTLFDEIIKDKKFEKYKDEYKNSLYEVIEKGFKECLNEYYKVKKIKINEIRILTCKNKKECADVMNVLDEPTISDCLKQTNNLLFVTIQKSGINKFEYHSVCYEKNIIKTEIIKREEKLDCFTNDPVTYIKLPIGPSGINVYISYLSALMILQSDIRIFYLMRINDSYKPIYCNNDDKNSIPVYYVAECEGKKCATKELFKSTRSPIKKSPVKKKTTNKQVNK